MTRGNRDVIVGRDGEWARLAAALDDARRGRGRTVVVEGEAGIGKTALVGLAVAAAARDGIYAFSGRAEELDRRRPFAALAACLGHRAGPADPRVAAVLALLHRRCPPPPPPAAGGDPASDEFHLAEAVLALVEDLSASGPVVVALDDLQWADSASLRALLALARSAAQLPLLVLCATRPAPHGPDLVALLAGLAELGAESLRLAGLGDEDLPTLVELWAGAPPGPNLLARLGAAGGNPLFLGEIVDALIDAGELRADDGLVDVGAAGVPPTLPVTVLQRLRFCSAATLDTLSFAAVLGRAFTAADLSAVKDAPVARLVPALREGLRVGMLRERGGSLEFRHDLIRDSLYDDLPATVRQELHLAVARALANLGAAPSRVGEHLLRGATRPEPGVLDLVHHTAVAAVDAAPQVAVELLEHALGIPGLPAPARDRLLPDLAVALLRAGRAEEGEAACRRAIDQGLVPLAPTSLRLSLVNSLAARGRVAETLAEAERGLGDADLTTTGRCVLEAMAAGMRLFVGDVTGAEAAAGSAASSAARSGERVAESMALGTLALTARLSGRFREALELAEQSAAAADVVVTFDSQHHVPHVVRALMLIEVDRVEEALAASRHGLQLAEKVGAPDCVAWHHLAAARCMFLLGAWDEAATEAEVVLQLADSHDMAWTAEGLLVLAMISLFRGDLLGAQRIRQRAERELTQSGTRFLPGVQLSAEALLQEADGRADQALDTLRAGWDLCADLGLRSELPWLGPDLVRLAVATGRHDAGRGVPEAIERLAADNPTVAAVRATAARCRGVAERDPSALLAAVAAYRSGQRPFELARTLEGAAAALAEAGRTEEARPLAQEAWETYSGLRAARCQAHAESLLRTLGVRRGRRGPRRRPRTGWEAVTDTELMVVRLVAERLSNPQIAERLFISRRTVQTHVSHVLAKLGVSSRAELAAAATQHYGWQLTLGGNSEPREDRLSSPAPRR